MFLFVYLCGLCHRHLCLEPAHCAGCVIGTCALNRHITKYLLYSLQFHNNNNNNNNNNQDVHTDREVTANRPDIKFKNKKEKTCTLIDVAIPADRNIVQKETEKKLKCKSLCIEMQRMWNLKCTIVPVIIGATGIVTRNL